MAKKKIALLAGTLVDTKMGVDILEEEGILTKGYPLASDCNEQNKLQFLEKEVLREIALNKLLDAKRDGYENVLVYCNSLSATIDFKELAEETVLNIKTPFDAYAEISENMENLLIISANSNSLNVQETYLKELNPDINFITTGVLTYVDLIEKGTDPEKVYEEYGLKELLQFFEKMPLKGKKSILLGCTHFPYLKEKLDEETDMDILDPMGILMTLF